MTPGSVRPAGWIFAFLALLTAAGAVWAASADANAHSDVQRFDAAPVCGAHTPPTATEDCKAELRATVTSVSVSAGKNPAATLTLRTSDGFAVVADIKADVRPDPGDDADVTLWRGRCVTVRTDGQGTITTYDSPAWHLNNDGVAFLAAMGFTVLFESVAALLLTSGKVDRERMTAAYLLAAVPLLITAMLRFSHAYTAAIVASIAVPLLVLGLYVTWPRLTWAQRRV